MLGCGVSRDEGNSLELLVVGFFSGRGWFVFQSAARVFRNRDGTAGKPSCSGNSRFTVGASPDLYNFA
jgi:hypothetical protein